MVHDEQSPVVPGDEPAGVGQGKMMRLDAPEAVQGYSAHRHDDGRVEDLDEGLQMVPAVCLFANGRATVAARLVERHAQDGVGEGDGSGGHAHGRQDAVQVGGRRIPREGETGPAGTPAAGGLAHRQDSLVTADRAQDPPAQAATAGAAGYQMPDILPVVAPLDQGGSGVQVGCHLSVARGFAGAARKAPRLAATAFQYFGKNPRSLRPSRPPDPEDTRRGREAVAEHGLLTVVHAAYLINLCAADAAMRAAAMASLVQEMEFAHVRGTPFVVVHCGKYTSLGEAEGTRIMRESVQEVLAVTPPDVMLLLENTAGQGTELGTDPDQLLRFMDISEQRLGICYDTCHAFAAGMLDPLRPDHSPGIGDPAFWSRVHMVHLNDSVGEQGSRRDRHARIGQGAIGQAGMARILHSDPFVQRPIVVETPVEDEDEYAGEIAKVHRLAGDGSP